MSTRRKRQRERRKANPRTPLPESVIIQTRTLRTTCPVCDADALGLGEMDCCGAEVGDCAGEVQHFWYEDDGEPAPNPYEDDPTPCRCAA